MKLMLIHQGTQKIETKRLILRPFELSDAQSMFKNWANDKEVCKFLSWEPHEKIQVTEQIVKGWIEEYRYTSQYNWAIELKDKEEIIGEIAVIKLSERHNSCEIGYCLGKDFWSQGIMTEALKAIKGYMFEEVGINRICAKHHTQNIASGKVMQKCGMLFEGVMRQVKVDKHGDFYDLAVYAALKADK